MPAGNSAQNRWIPTCAGIAIAAIDGQRIALQAIGNGLYSSQEIFDAPMAKAFSALLRGGFRVLLYDVVTAAANHAR